MHVGKTLMHIKLLIFECVVILLRTLYPFINPKTDDNSKEIEDIWIAQW